MNSYGDPSSPRGRAQIPGSNGDPGPGADNPYQRPDHDTPPVRRPSAAPADGWSANGGSAANGPASGGRASVPPSGSAAAGRATSGRASVGSASVGGSTPGGPEQSGRARVGGRAGVPASPDGGYGGGYGGTGYGGTGYGDGGYGGNGGHPNGGRDGSRHGDGAAGDRPAGRAVVGAASVGAASVGAAPVGAAPVGGRARVGGRAMVRPVSPAGPGDGGGPGGTGPGGPGGFGPDGRGGSGGRADRDPDALRRAKKRKRVNLLIASFAVLIMLAGGGVVLGTYYSTTVPLPDDVVLPEASTILASDGKKQLAKVGEQNRTLVTSKQIPDHVQKAVASAEDRKFYDHSGVDYAGIARAAWNNFTGGSRQGASTITQQYARNAYDNLEGATYARKVREAVLASKLNDKFSKEEMMQHYLNTIYFGRGAYGIEAAALTYFGHSASKLTVAEAAVLAAVIKQPTPDESTGHKGYDPAVNPEEAKIRWNYVLDGMEEKGWMPAGQQRPTEYPKFNPLPKPGACIAECGANTPNGNVINYVRAEMAEKGLCKPETCDQEIRDGGYRITTSIDYKMQQALIKIASRKVKGSELSDQPKNLMTGVVAVDPKTGRVLAYYGGETGTGHDYAGKNVEGGVLTGGHPPGSSFKAYTLAAALDNDISLQSHWDATPFTPEGVKFKVRNVADVSKSCGKWCSLEESTIKSFNVPFYHITEEIGPAKVLDMSRRAGVTTMWTSADNPPKPYDLTTAKLDEIAPSTFFHVVGYGQYPITVLDHANGMATLANRGLYNKAHFLVKVQQKNSDGEWEDLGGEQLKPKQTIRKEVADDVTSVLKKIPGNNGDALSGGRPATGKTGTWELNEKSSDNAHAWMVGYTPQLATAVWVGNEKKEQALKDKNGNKIGGSNLPADIWKRFMNEALKGEEVKQFADGKGIGNPDAGNGKSPSPKPPEPQPGTCDNPFGFGCPPGTFNPGQNPNPNPNPNPNDPNPGGPGNGGPGNNQPGGGGGTGLLSTPPAPRRE